MQVPRGQKVFQAKATKPERAGQLSSGGQGQSGGSYRSISNSKSKSTFSLGYQLQLHCTMTGVVSILQRRMNEKVDRCRLMNEPG